MQTTTEISITYSCCFCNYKISKNESTFKKHIKATHSKQKLPSNELHRLNLRYCNVCNTVIKVTSAWCRSCVQTGPKRKRNEDWEKECTYSVPNIVQNVESIKDPYEFDRNNFQSLYYIDDFEILNVSHISFYHISIILFVRLIPHTFIN